MGAARHYPEQKSTASPFVATFPATNLLPVSAIEPQEKCFIQIKKQNVREENKQSTEKK